MKSYRVLRKAVAFLGTVFLMVSLLTGSVLAADQTDTCDEVDFRSCRLIVMTENPSIFPENAPILSSYNDVFLLQFENEEMTKEAYQYYLDLADLVETDSGIRICEENTEEEGEVLLMTMEENPLSLLEENVQEAAGMDDQIVEDPAPYDIALIDTGAAGEHVAKAVSMIGDDPADYNGHGTRMAAFIAEENPDAEILSIKALGDDGRGQISAVYAAIEYAISQKVKIISLSASARALTDDSILREVIKRAVSEGILFVGSAGNDGSDAGNYVPGNIEAAIIVGACDEQGRRLSASNYGSTVDYYIHAGSTSEAAARLSGRLSREPIESILDEWEEGFLFTQDNGDTIEEEAVYYQVNMNGERLPETDFRTSITQQFYSVQGLGENDLLYYTYVNNVWTPAYCIDHGKTNPNGENYTYNATTNNIIGHIIRNGYHNVNWGLSGQEAQFITQSAVFGALGVPFYNISDGQHSPYWIWNHTWGDGTFTEGSSPGNIGHFQIAEDLLNFSIRDAIPEDAKFVNYWTPASGTYQRMITPSRATTSVKVVKSTSAGTSCSSQLTGNAMYSANFSGAKFKVSIYDTYAGSWSTEQTYQTGNDGSFTVSGIYVGNKVRAEETQAPKGYLLPSQTRQELTLAADNNQLKFSDAPAFAQNVPVIRKVSYVNGALQEDTVAGAIFKMEYFDNAACTGNAVRTWYFRTGSDGKFSYSADSLAQDYTSDALYKDTAGKTNLPLGSIKITETESPEGYLCYSGSIQARIVQETNGGPAVFSWITESGGQIVLNADGSAVIGNEKSKIAVDKVDASTGASLSGAHLQILDGEEILLEWDTDGQPHVITVSLFPEKTYTIKETEAPNDYRLAEDILFRINSDGTVTILTNNVDVAISPEGYPVICMKDAKMIRMPAAGSTERMTILLIGFLLFCGGAGTGACFLAKRKHPKAVKAVVAAGIGVLALGILTSPVLAAGDLWIERSEDVVHTYTAYQLFYGEVQEDEMLWNVHLSEDIPYVFWDKLGVDPDHRAATEIAEWMAEQIKADADGRFAVQVAKAVLAESTILPDGEIIPWEEITLPDGYYILISPDAQPILCLLKNRELMMIQEKSDFPTVKKEIGDLLLDGTVIFRKVADTGIDGIVPYQITGTLPVNYNAFETYTYCFQDRFEKGIAIVTNSVEVMIEDTEGNIVKEITDEAEIIVTDTELSVNFPDLKAVYPSYREGDALVVEYAAYLTEGFSVGADPNRNEVWIEYSRNPVFEGLGKSMPDQCRLYTWELGLCKHAADTEECLAGAGFLIANEDGEYLNPNGTTTFDEEEAYVWESDANGRIQISGVDSGKYTVTEVRAPRGYLPVDEFCVIIEAEYLDEERIVLHADTIGLDTDLLLVDAKTGRILISVTDQPEPAAPKTGDQTKMGRYLLAGSMAVLAILSGVVLMLRNAKRKTRGNQGNG